jgi:anaerobic selenocysteine-containing dehydrogenase
MACTVFLTNNFRRNLFFPKEETSMEIDRRSFLAFAIGGGAGTMLSPIPWKLMDDVAIWSQNWPWTPVPEKGEITYVNTTCTLCPGGCGLTVRKAGERVVKLEGRQGHPANDGGICTLGAAGAQLLYGPTRIKSPMKKVNGSWLTISWDAAVAEIVEKLNDLRSSGLSHTLACISDSDRGSIPQLFNRFLTVYGSPNFIRTPSIQDSYELCLYLTQGVQAMAGFDLSNSDFILSFGSGLIEGWQSPVYMFRAKSALREKNGRMDQVEPRLSKTAAKSNNWFAIHPGTEGALALGLAHVIIKENLYHREFINNYVSGFAVHEKLVIDGYPPEIVSKITGLETAKIISLARDFARARKPLAICGRGEGNNPGGLQEFLAVHTLNALVGNINKPGGILAVPEPDYISWPDVEIDSVAANGLQQPRVDGAGSGEYPLARYLLNRVPGAMNSGQDAPIQALFVTSANPMYTLQGSQAVHKAFEKIPFVVSFSSVMDDTAANADLILPNHVYLERYEDVAAARGFPRPIIGLVQPVVEPLFNTRHVGDVIIQIANEMGGTMADAFAWESYEVCLKETLTDIWDTLTEEGYWADAEFAGGDWGATFETGSSKFEFSNKDIENLPRYNPVKPEGDETHYPLILIPYDSMRLTSGYVGSPPFLVKSVEDTILKENDVLVEINPATAKEFDLKEGSSVTMHTPKGDAKVKVHLFDGIVPGVIAMVRGLGHSAYDQFLAGKGVNYSALCASVEDAASGHDAAWGIRAKLSKA